MTLYGYSNLDERLTAEIPASRIEDLDAYVLIITVNDEEFVWREDIGVLSFEEAEQIFMERD